MGDDALNRLAGCHTEYLIISHAAFSHETRETHDSLNDLL